MDFLESAGATLAVATTSAVSGILDVGESLVDGGAWVASKVVGLVSDDAEDAMKEFISRDLVSEANEAFYENTELGKAINEASVLKYDSEAAQGIRDFSGKVTVFAAATAATICTGGGAAAILTPLGLGFASGVGNKAEDVYQEHGTDTTLSQELGIAVSGIGEAANWYAQGKLGEGLGKFVNSIKSPVLDALKNINLTSLKNTGAKIVSGTKNIIGKIEKNGIITPLKNIFKGAIKNSSFASLKATDNLMDSIGIIGDNYSAWLLGEEKLNSTNALKAGGELIAAWGLNMFFDGFGEFAKNKLTKGNIEFDDINWNSVDNTQSATRELIKAETLTNSSEAPIVRSALDISLEKYSVIKQSLNKINELKKLGKSVSYTEMKSLLLEISNSGLTMEEIKQIIPFHEQVNLGYIFIDDNVKKWLQKSFYSFDSPIDCEDFASNLLNINLLEDALTRGSMFFGSVINPNTGKSIKLDFYCELLNSLPEYQKKIYLTKILNTLTFNEGKVLTTLEDFGSNHKSALTKLVNGLQEEKVSTSFLDKLLTGNLSIDDEFEYMSYYLQKSTRRDYADCYTSIYDSIRDAYLRGNKEAAYINMMGLTSCANGVDFCLEPGKAYVTGTSRLVLDSMVDSQGTAYHEFGHLLHNTLANKHIPSNIDTLLANAKQNGEINITDLIGFQESNNRYNELLRNLGKMDFENNIIQRYGSIDNQKESIYYYVKELINDEHQSISEILSANGVSEETIKIITGLDLEEELLIDQVVNSIYNQELNAHCELFQRKSAGEAASDMIAAIYKTNHLDINGTNIPLTFSHDIDYWNKDQTKSFSELFANYNNLKMNGKIDIIEKMKSIFGTELFDALENIYNIAQYL